MVKLVVAMVVVLTLASVACGNGEVLEGDVNHKTVPGVIESTSYTIIENRPGSDQDVDNDRPSILVSDPEFSGFFATRDGNAVIRTAMETELAQKYSSIRYIVKLHHSDAELGIHPSTLTVRSSTIFP